MSTTEPLIVEDRHTGERLALRRVSDGQQTWLEMKGSLPPRSPGPPLHVHVHEDEEWEILRGVQSVILEGEQWDVPAGGTVRLPHGRAHRWWNDGDEPLEFEGATKPVVDLDRYLQAVFDVVNASPPNRPSPVYMAHVLRRHWKTQRVLVMPRPVMAVVVWVVYAVGHLLGRYRGDAWPGCPSRCPGAPTVSLEELRREGR